MRVTFYGGAEEVGRSCVIIEKGKRSIMLDCGIKLGEETQYPLISDSELQRIENIALSHAHLDHSGYLPHVYSKRAKPKIFLTKPTRDLMAVLLSDYCRLHTESTRRKLFTQKDVDNILKDANIVDYNEEVKGTFDMTFHPAGHIIGSAMIKIKENNGILYTGDICVRKTKILEGCERELKAETLIMESTYGGKDDVIPSYKDSANKLVASINKTLDSGGHVIIPSFAVGRAQEILLILDDYMRSGALQKTKIYIEGMIGKALRIYRHNAIYASEELKRRILMSEDDPFKASSFHYSRSKKREDVLAEPCIILSTSGMLSGGPVLFYLQALGQDPKNKMIFVGYQAPGTPGRKLIDGERKLKIRDVELDLKLQIESVKISGHADFNELLQFVKGIKGLKRVFIMHGEKTDLKDALEKSYEVVIPRLLESYGL
jgi:predicted metal-dependent RNase